MKLKILLFSSLLSVSAIGFEINTHQAITQCALSNKCYQKGAENLNYFTQTMKLAGKRYEHEEFENYKGESYFEYATSGDGLGEYKKEGDKVTGKFINFEEGKTYLKNAKDKDGNIILDKEGNPTNLIDYQDRSFITLIEAGSILEDAIYPHSENMVGADGYGRFNNHLYSSQFSYPVDEPYAGHYFNSLNGYKIVLGNIVKKLNSYRLTSQTLLADNLLDAYPANRTDAISWALDNSVFLGAFQSNEYTLPDAFEYFRKSFEGTVENREKYQAKLFVALGHALHLLEDIHSPAHVRNGPHAGGDYLEIFGRYNEGFFLRNGTLASTIDPDILTAIKEIDIKDVMLTKNAYASYQDFFVKEADWVSRNFFSEAHDFNPMENAFYDGRVEPGVDLRSDRCGEKNTTIFDSRNTNLAELQTNTQLSNVFWDYITTYGNASTVLGEVPNNTVVAFERNESSIWGDKCRTMAAPKEFVSYSSESYSDFDKTALKDTLKNVIPRAVASVQSFTNFFFRGRMEASLSFDNQYIVIKNTSDPNLVYHWDLTTFRKDPDPNLTKSFTLYFMDENDLSIELGKYPLYEDIQPTLEGAVTSNKYAIKIGDILSDKNIQVGDNDKLILLFEGQIGQDVGIDDYDLDAKGMSVAYVKKSMVKQTEQTESYTNFDDGWFKKGAISAYIRNPRDVFDDPASTISIDTVLDVVTGLQWQDNIDVETTLKPWKILNAENDDTSGDTATTFCNNLSLAGNNDWRLPTVRELLSISDYSRHTPAIDTQSFIHHGTSSYWSSTSSAHETAGVSDNRSDKAWHVGLNDGYAGTSGYKYQNASVRCVRNYIN